MSYTTYITDALVCGSRALNTADKSYLLFTRDAGMLYATAKSVREERSKQRFALQEFSYLRVTLVSGKTGWRVTGTEPIMNTYTHQSTREGRTLLRNVVRLLRRLMQGESAHPHLFDDVLSVISHGDESDTLEREEVLTIRMLHELGYLPPTPAVASILSAPSPVQCVRNLDSTFAAERKKLIEHALRESHL